jgi:hypothetical protein
MFCAVHPTTDIAEILRHVRFVPMADVAAYSITSAAANQSGCILHDLKPLSLQFEYYGHGQMRAFLRLDPIRASPFRVVFLWVTVKGRANGELDHILRIIPHLISLVPTRFSSLSLFPLLDEPQPRKTNGDDHHDDEDDVLYHRNCPELLNQ